MQIDEIYLALTELQRAQAAHDEAMEGYQGYSWGYHGYRYFEAVSKAQANLKTALDSYIDERVNEALTRRLAQEA